MAHSHSIEDIFLEFYLLTASDRVPVQWQDSTPITSFAATISNGTNLTKAQSGYILRLLTKYKAKAKDAGLDYEMNLINPTWKQDFRVLDMSKKIHVEMADDLPQVCIKFPFEFKKTFDLEFSEVMASSSSKSWDADRKLRTYPLFSINLVALNEFILKHGFEIDDTFASVLATVEETWLQQDTVIPYAEVVGSTVELVNAHEDALTFWNEFKTGDINNDMMLAKSMNYIVRLPFVPESDVEKIAASPESMFWVRNNVAFFELYKKVSTGAVVVILDRTSDTHAWIRDFVMNATQAGVDRSDIKVCFRETDLAKSGRFNEWVKEQGLGGSVDTGRIFIFENKPAKWLFTKGVDVKLIVTNNIYPNANTLTQQWIENHPCVLYLGDIKPSQKRNLKIVEL